MSARWICPEPAVNPGGFVGNGLEVVIPEGGFRGLGPMNRLEPAPAGGLVSLSREVAPSWNAAFKGKLPGLAGALLVVGSGLYTTNRKQARMVSTGACSAHLAQKKVPRPVRSQSALTSITLTRKGYVWRRTSGGRVPLSDPGRWHLCGRPRSTQRPVSPQWKTPRLARRQASGSRWGASCSGGPGGRTSGVRHMWHNIYFGGDWPHTKSFFDLIIDELAVSTHGRVGCMDQFPGRQFEPLQACPHRIACPRAPLWMRVPPGLP